MTLSPLATGARGRICTARSHQSVPMADCTSGAATGSALPRTGSPASPAPVRTAISISSIWPANTPLRFRATPPGLAEPRRRSWNAGGSSFQRPPAAIEALRNALETADDEAAMQRLLEKHPALLAGTVVGTRDTWIRPQVQLGNHYMADFMIAGQTSLGVRWTLVELESPVSRLTNPGNRRATATLRHAVDQIEDWRRWLSTNLHYARSARDADGLGLPGITAEVPGLIIMARETYDDAAAEIRELHVRRSHIQVRTYDWLMRINESPDPLRRDAPDQRLRLA